MPLASDATLRDVVNANTLNEPVRYVRGVLENMLDCRRQFGTATVQLGITGDGRSPNYQVSPARDPDEDIEAWLDYYVEAMTTGNDPKQRFAAYHGMSHKRLAFGAIELRHKSWSDEWSDYEEVRALLGELRGNTGKTRDWSAVPCSLD